LGTIFIIIGLSVLVLVAITLLRATAHTLRQIKVEPAVEISFDTKALSIHLLQAIRMKTTPHRDRGEYKGEDFAYLHELFELNFPLVHTRLSREKVWDYSLLFTWKGQDEGLKPVLYMGHLDVAPAESIFMKDQGQSAFDGHITEGYIWGKGTQDDKYAVIGILEAVEKLLQMDFTPRRTLYLAFGHDEEIGGQGGAFHIGALLHARGVELEYVLDEGPPITEGILPSILKPVALVGIAEKGTTSIELSVDVKGGHTIMPPHDMAISILSKALHKLAQNPFPARMEKPVRQMFESLIPRMPFIQKVLFANLWLFERLVEKRLSALPWTNALIRTMAVPTMIYAGTSKNTLPATAKAAVNLRILPSDNIKEVLNRIKSIIDDPRVSIKHFDIIMVGNTLISDTSSPGFKTIEYTVRQIYPEALVAPTLYISETDSRYLTQRTNNIFRFSPIRLKPESLQRYVHGSEEKISIEDYVQVVRFYLQLILNSDSVP
jgi:carboxypeptidase PM20D1